MLTSLCRGWASPSACVLFILGCIICGSAQTETATLSGRVFDPSGLGVVGAQVSLVDVDRNTTNTTHTANTGLYIFSSVRPGQYRLQVSATGFRTVNLTSMTINAQDSLQQNVKLAVGSISESVTVEASSTPAEVSGAVATVVDQKIIQDAPLNGRSFQTLFQLTPGVVITPTSFADQGQFSVNGQRADANYFTIDGASANAGVGAGNGGGQVMAGAQPALNAAGGTNGLVSVDAVQEFAIQTSSFAPEYGRTPGAQISIVTKSGNNELHGNVFDYLRNDIFDANDWFANHNNLKRPALRQNDFGGTLGGPIIRDRTFFFFSYEGLRLRQPTIGITDVPDMATRAATPSELQPFVNAFPLPTGPTEGNGMAPAVYSFSNPSTLNATSLRIDHHFTSSLSAFARYNYSPSSALSRGNFTSLNGITKTSITVQTLTLGLTDLVTPKVTNDVRFNWTRSVGGTNISLDSFGGAKPFDPALVFPSPFTARDSSIVFFVGSGINSEIELGRNSANTQRQINVLDNLSWQAGSHLFRFGVDYRRLTPHIATGVYSSDVFFSDSSSLIANTPAFGSVISSIPSAIFFNNYSVYAQDTWTTSRRLNFTYGLRWDYNPTPTGGASNGLTPVVVRGITDPSTLSAAPNGTALYRATKNNFAPRAGFTYQLRAVTGRELLLKGGAGIFYDLGTGPVAFAFSFAPFQASRNVAGPFPFTSADAASVPVTGNPPFFFGEGFPPTLRLPYTYHWNLALGQSLGNNQKISLGYVGAAAHSLERITQYTNGLSPEFPNGILYIDNSGYSNYNSLQAQFRRRTAGFDLVASYTLAHALDNGSTDVGSISIPGSVIDPRKDYGAADFDIRHTGTFAASYDVPRLTVSPLMKALFGGWGIDPVLTARSASPVDVVVQRTIAAGTYNFRPDRVPGVPLYLDDPSVAADRRINPAAFNVPSEPKQGDLQRNSVRAFPLIQLDVAIRRRFALTERVGLEGRFEAFNLFNHPNFAPPQHTLGFVDPNGVFVPQNGFGISQSMLNRSLQQTSQGVGFNPLYQIGGPRSLQVALKLSF
jgi:hypothetical protein